MPIGFCGLGGEGLACLRLAAADLRSTPRWGAADRVAMIRGAVGDDSVLHVAGEGCER